MTTPKNKKINPKRIKRRIIMYVCMLFCKDLVKYSLYPFDSEINFLAQGDGSLIGVLYIIPKEYSHPE